MTWLDIVILLPLLIGLVRGTMRGLITEVIAILAVILGFIGAKIWGQIFSTWLLTQFTWPQPVCDAVAYALLFLGIAIELDQQFNFIQPELKNPSIIYPEAVKLADKALDYVKNTSL